MSLITSLYEANDYETDMCVFKTVVPLLKAKISFNKCCKIGEPLVFEEYDNLSENVQKIFRNLVYEKQIELDCTKTEFLELIDFLKMSLFFKIDFLPLFRRYIYKHLDDMDFLKTTVSIHRDRFFLRIKSRLQFGLLLCGMKELDRDKIISLYREGDPDATYVYGILADSDEKGELSKEIHYKNYIQNKHSESYQYYLNITYRNDPNSRSEVLKMHYQNYVENKNSESLFDYAHILGTGNSEEIKRAKEYHSENWNENRNMASLDEYAFFIRIGLGSNTIDTEKARELFYFNATKNKFSSSINTYASFLETEGKFEEAKNLYFINWEENSDFYSLQKFIDFLEKGIGGEKNLEKAKAMKALL
jgi:hypothetical protein